MGRVYSGLQSGLDITNPRDRDRLIRYGYFGISALRRGVVIHDSTSPIVSCAYAKGGFIVGFSSSSFSSYKIPQVSSCKVSHTVPTDILCYKVNLQLNSYTMRRDECKLSLNEANSRLISSFSGCAASWSGRSAATASGNMAVSEIERAQMKLKGSQFPSHIQFERPGRHWVTHGGHRRQTTAASGSTAAGRGHTHAGSYWK